MDKIQHKSGKGNLAFFVNGSLVGFRLIVHGSEVEAMDSMLKVMKDKSNASFSKGDHDSTTLLLSILLLSTLLL